MHVIAFVVLVAAAAAVLTGHASPSRHKTQDELRAERLVQLRVRLEVDCHDSHVVNRKLVPEAPGYYICRRSDGLNYQAIVSADGLLTSLSGPFRIRD
jgi:hypothetical protein